MDDNLKSIYIGIICKYLPAKSFIKNSKYVVQLEDSMEIVYQYEFGIDEMEIEYSVLFKLDKPVDNINLGFDLKSIMEK